MPSENEPENDSQTPEQGPITALLLKLSAGDEQAGALLFEQVYDQLRRMAAGQMNQERPDHTFQATDLVHEAFVQLIDKEQVTPENRAHFFAMCSTCMRRILVDYARARNAQKRGGNQQLFRLEDVDELPGVAAPEQILNLHMVLESLEKIDNVRARLVEMRLFAGLTLEEAAFALNMPYTTIQRKWKATRAWLQDRL